MAVRWVEVGWAINSSVKQMLLRKERQRDRQTQSINNRQAVASTPETGELLGLVERALAWRQARR